MGYLNPIRIHFAGQFQADPPSINNDVRHFSAAQANPAWQCLNTNTAYNGWWNPDGSGSFRFVGCTVRSVAYADGTISTDDPVCGLQIMGANARVAGKLVDLDPQQQMVSQLWGLLVRLTDGMRDLVAGPFAVAPFTDLWFRAHGFLSDAGMGAFYQSVVGPVRWGDTSGSRILEELRAAAPDGLMSIKFNVDGYNPNYGSPGFTLGRCAGTIGPASPNEPAHFTLGRQLLPGLMTDPQLGVVADCPMNFMQAVVDCATLYVDFGNALPAMTPGSDMEALGEVAIGWLDASDAFHAIGTLANYTAAGWYERAAGVQAFPLTQDQAASLAANRVAVAVDGWTVLRENDGGIYVRADDFVYRLNPGEPANVSLWATQYGRPLANQQISIAADPSQLQGGPPVNDPQVNIIAVPPVATPATALSFWSSVTTGANGTATLTIGSSDPGNIRGYIDGQLYGVRYLPQATANAVGNPPSILIGQASKAFGFNPSDFVSILVWTQYAQPADPQWSDVFPILQPYTVLYPVMDQLINLTSKTEVTQQAALLQLAFSLPVTDPNSMPVTRDLSAAKRATLLQYLAAQIAALPNVRKAPRGKPVPTARLKSENRGGETLPTANSKTIALGNREGGK